MRHHLRVKGPLDVDEVRTWLEHPLGRLRRQLARYPADGVHLSTLVRGPEDGARGEVGLTLRLPSRTLAVSEEGSDVHAALGEAFRELERVLGKEKARLRRAQTWRRSAERFERDLLERVTRASERALSQAESDLVRGHLQEIGRFVRHELRWLEADGDLAAGEIDPRDVVDAAFEATLAGGDRHPSRSRLVQAAAAALRAELARIRQGRDEIHIEEDVPEVAPERAVSTLGSEVLDFHQPDEDWHVEDLLAGLSETPEQVQATAELAAALWDALRAAPPRWRQAFRLAQVEDLDAVAIAKALDVDVEAVPELIAHARAFLRERLEDMGLSGDEARSTPSPGPEAAVQAHRAALTDRARARHDALTDAIDRLENALAAPALRRAQPWSDRVATELESVRRAIGAHVEDVEQPKGLLEEIQVAAPRHTRRLSGLRHEHASLIARASVLAGRLSQEEEADFRSLRREAALLLDDLRAHRAAEADLVYDAFWTDLGAVD